MSPSVWEKVKAAFMGGGGSTPELDARGVEKGGIARGDVLGSA